MGEHRDFDDGDLYHQESGATDGCTQKESRLQRMVMRFTLIGTRTIGSST